MKCAESSAAATAAAAAASFESQVNDEILQSLQSSMSVSRLCCNVAAFSLQKSH